MIAQKKRLDATQTQRKKTLALNKIRFLKKSRKTSKNYNFCRFWSNGVFGEKEKCTVVCYKKRHLKPPEPENFWISPHPNMDSVPKGMPYLFIAKLALKTGD